MYNVRRWGVSLMYLRLICWDGILKLSFIVLKLFIYLSKTKFKSLRAAVTLSKERSYLGVGLFLCLVDQPVLIWRIKGTRVLQTYIDQQK